MFARIFGSSDKKAETVSLIESQEEFKEILGLIKKLRAKEENLKKNSGGNVSSLAHRKSIILDDLLKQIDVKIKLFNESPTIQGEHKNEIKQPDQAEKNIQLLNELYILIKTCYMTFVETLNQHRHTLSQHQNEAASHLVDMGSVATGLLAGAACTTGIGAVITFTYASMSFNKGVKGLLGIEKAPPKTDTSIIICEFIDVLEKIIKNVGLAFNLKSKDKKKISDHPEEYICLITQDLMKDPYFCKKDEKNYEKKAIVKWITEKGTSPWTREAVTIDDLQENVNLRNEIQKYLASKPELADPESAAGLRLA